MPASGPDQPEAMRKEVGGASKSKTIPPGWTCHNARSVVGNHKGSQSHTLAPLSEVEEESPASTGSHRMPVEDLGQVRTTLVPPPSPSASRKAPVAVQEEAFEVSPVRLVSCSSVDEWLEQNTPSLLDEGARIALSGRDPMFRSMFFGKLLDYQREVKSASLKAKGHVLGKVVETNPERKALMDAADEVSNMGAGELAVMLRDAGAE